MGDVTNNNFTESENSVLSRDAGGPKFSHKMHMSFDAINNHVSKMYDKFVLTFLLARTIQLHCYCVYII